MTLNFVYVMLVYRDFVAAISEQFVITNGWSIYRPLANSGFFPLNSITLENILGCERGL